MVTRTCLICGKQFSVAPSQLFWRNVKYCSIQCAATAKRTGRTLKELHCEQCGKTFSVTTYKANRSKHHYCSARCSGIANQRQLTATCETCGKEFQRNPIGITRQEHHYCSRKCSDRAKENHNIVPCSTCGKPVKLKPFFAKKFDNHYCSKECASIGKRSGAEIVCLNCGKRIYLHPERIARKQKFCSTACYLRFRGENTLEQTIRLAITAIGIPFEQEYRIGRYCIDFYLPTLNIALEVDGEYWHRNHRERDNRRDQVLKDKGIQTIRISDSEIVCANDTVELVKNKLGGLP